MPAYAIGRLTNQVYSSSLVLLLFQSLSHIQLFCDPMDCSLPVSCPWDSPGKNTGVGCPFLLHGISGYLPFALQIYLLPSASCPVPCMVDLCEPHQPVSFLLRSNWVYLMCSPSRIWEGRSINFGSHSLDSKVIAFFKVVIVSIHLFPNGSWKPLPHPRNCTMSLIPSLHIFPSLNLLGLSLFESAMCFLLQPWLKHKFHKKEENWKETMKKEKKHWIRNRIQKDTKINKPSKTWNFTVWSSLWVLVHVLCSGMGTRYLDLVTLPKVMWPVGKRITICTQIWNLSPLFQHSQKFCLAPAMGEKICSFGYLIAGFFLFLMHHKVWIYAYTVHWDCTHWDHTQWENKTFLQL